MSKLGTFQHPGFPRIGAVETFRRNAAKEIDDLENEVRTEIENIEAYEQTTISHTGRNALNVRKSQAPLKFNAYFDKSAYKGMNDHINQEVRALMQEAMTDAIEGALDNTKNQISDMPRAFKSNINPSGKASGDLYDRVAEGFYYTQKLSQGNQFASFEAYGEAEGSRGADLIAITEEGTGPFEAFLVSSVYRNPAKRNFKGA